MKVLSLAAGAALSLASVTSANAAFINGGFEGTPDLTGYALSGNTSVQGSDFHATVEGTQQGFLATSEYGGNGTPVSASALETFVNLSSGSLSTGHSASNGSAICQQFTATEGQVLTVHFDFLTNERQPTVLQTASAAISVAPSNNDFGFLTLQKDAGAGTLTILADTNSLLGPTNPLEGANSFAISETGYLTYTTTLSAGTYKLCLGVANATDTLNASGLLVDAIEVTGGSTVPLPAAVLVAPLGAAVAGFFGKRLRGKSAK
jgi:hypothetical protein